MSEVDMEQIYERGRSFAMDLLKTTLTLSTAVVGALFLALTGDHGNLYQDELDVAQRALKCTTLAVAAGLAGWAAFAASYGSVGAGHPENKARWRLAMKILLGASVILLLFGVANTARYAYRAGKHKVEETQKKLHSS
jgi:hypothetical protein